MTFEQLILGYIDGKKIQMKILSSTTGTLRIKGEQLVHYWTPIAERWNGKIIVNVSRYSLATGKLQKQLRELIPEHKYVTV